MFLASFNGVQKHVSVCLRCKCTGNNRWEVLEPGHCGAAGPDGWGFCNDCYTCGDRGEIILECDDKVAPTPPVGMPKIDTHAIKFILLRLKVRRLKFGDFTQ